MQARTNLSSGAIVTLLLLSLSISTNAFAQTDAANKRQDDAIADGVAAAAKRMEQQQTYDLRYKLSKGEKVRWQVVHNAATKVQMAGFTEESSSRSESVKVWEVSNVDGLGNITFVQSLESVKNWTKTDDEEAVSYDSQTDTEVPEKYQTIASQIGKPLAVFSISPYGALIDRKSSLKTTSFGVGKITIPLPGKPVTVGHRWALPTVLTANDENNRQKKVKARVLYELAKVSGHKAYIKFRTEILTPRISEKVKSTIMQQMTEGYVVFDVNLGRPISKQIEWNEKAQGFEGPDSSLTYIGRMDEKLLDAKPTAKVNIQNEPSASTSAKIRTRESEPVVRR